MGHVRLSWKREDVCTWREWMDVCCGLVYDHGRDRAMILPSHYRACKSKERLRAGRRDVGERWKHYSSLLGRRAEGSLRSVHKPVD